MKISLHQNQIIASDGYPCETHSLMTSDGYQLIMFRIPYSPKLENENTTKRIVLLMHGASSSSDCFILNGPENSIAYILADAGYDVWLGNCRGNRYSKENIPSWHFTFDEMAMFDFPTMIDYVLDVTGETDLHYVGHSQGTTIYFALLSLVPKYNNIIRTAHLLAPTAYFTKLKLPLMRILRFVYGLAPTAYMLSHGINVTPELPSEIVAMFGSWACREHQFTRHICSNFLFSLSGHNPRDLNYVFA